MPTTTLEMPYDVVTAAQGYASLEHKTVAELFVDLFCKTYGFDRVYPDHAVKQAYTRKWWEACAPLCDIYVSDYVAEEASSGDPVQVSLRVAEISRHDSLAADNPHVRSLAMELLRTHAVPEKEVTDAFHIATAAVYGMDILLTYNCRHMANLATLPKTASVIALAGYECPKILTPEQALEVQYV